MSPPVIIEKPKLLKSNNPTELAVNEKSKLGLDNAITVRNNNSMFEDDSNHGFVY